ncbi:ubiquinone biosynthesis O-methyltransferase [Gloeophyllum trabeum ATCC 11539]|uniref:Ubiquinone biosynthesis O-methyltransferase, mitochondrial n=1 Tax=Gloeophyllum trabeum (strain ATCC 11539 / FP-39264 / Madison 617) TaxID=670483 RepID=S7QA05_GLOTA|nr:ubiquinone biosynthesis O-methyltransferase [Gloeophyllum trabeum ATCC 11539]EPQ56347.1 ubiquinone biosynthesis O-methyltransferase [Gloeophyllum trabeum ATCC 11539]
MTAGYGTPYSITAFQTYLFSLNSGWIVARRISKRRHFGYKEIQGGVHSRSSHDTSARRVDASPGASPSSTVNPSEIAFFSRLSQQWWDEHGEFAFLHKMNPIRMQFIREKILEITREEQGEDVAARMENGPGLLKGLDVLDVGCGGGLLSESLARLGACTLGIDASEANIGIASLHAAADPRLSSRTPSAASAGVQGSLTYAYTSAEELLRGSQRYDIVCSMEVLEHVDNPAGFLSACAELLKPGGHLFLSTIARTPLSYLLTIVAAEHILRKVSVGTHSHAKFINPSELVGFFQKYRSLSPPPNEKSGSDKSWITRTYEHGLPSRKEAEVRGMVYLPWKGAWVLAPRVASAYGAATACNYLFWVRKPTSDAL